MTDDGVGSIFILLKNKKRLMAPPHPYFVVNDVLIELC